MPGSGAIASPRSGFHDPVRAIAGVLNGVAENDPFNRLIVASGLAGPAVGDALARARTRAIAAARSNRDSETI